MGIRPSLSPKYGKNSIGERVILSYKEAGRTDSQIKNNTYPKIKAQPAKDKGNTGRSLLSDKYPGGMKPNPNSKDVKLTSKKSDKRKSFRSRK